MACANCPITVKQISVAAELLPCSQFAVSRAAYCIAYSTVAVMLLPDWQPMPDAEFPYIYMGVPAETGMLRAPESVKLVLSGMPSAKTLAALSFPFIVRLINSGDEQKEFCPPPTATVNRVITIGWSGMK